MPHRVVAKFDTNALLVEARKHDDGRATVFWTDGPRQSEEPAGSIEAAVAAVHEAKAQQDAAYGDEEGYEFVEVTEDRA